jgi:hypothetical protein
MRQIRIALRTFAKQGELDFDDPEMAEVLIAACTGRALIELLGSVIVDEVSISDDIVPDSHDDAPAWRPR